MDGGGWEVGSNSGRFPILQANRDPESNWEVDVAVTTRSHRRDQLRDVSSHKRKYEKISVA